MIRGERVTLRHWTDADLAPFAAMNDDPDVMLRMRAHLSRAESDAVVGRIRDHFEVHGFGLWAIDVPQIGFAGFVGIAKVPFELPVVDVTFEQPVPGRTLKQPVPGLPLKQPVPGLTLKQPVPGLLPEPFEIGWRLARAAWGHGYATEGARLALRHGFEVAKLPQIVSFTALDNLASIAVMERIGLTRRGEFDHPRLPAGHRLHRHVLYAKERP